MWAGAALLLLLPAAAMRFTEEVQWDAFDFFAASVLLFGAAGAIELAMRASRSRYYRAGALAAIGTSFLTIWVNGAVGMIGSEANAYNLLFLAVVFLAVLGSIVARFRASGMTVALGMAAAAQAAVAAGGMAADPRGGLFALAFGGLWLLAASLFRAAAQSEPRRG
jgi:hypothetical protein